MKRRQFIQASAAVSVSAAFPVVAIAAAPAVIEPAEVLTYHWAEIKIDQMRRPRSQASEERLRGASEAWRERYEKLYQAAMEAS